MSAAARHHDVVIVGGGAAGSAAAALLAREGVDAALIDPHPIYPADFRCEKIDQSQARLLRGMGLEAVLDAATAAESVYVARSGRLVDRTRGAPCGIRYEDLVKRLREEARPATPFVTGTVKGIASSGEGQIVTLTSGEQISARLVVLANGLNARLRRDLGITQRKLSRDHSVSVGFDMLPKDGSPFSFPALTYYPERVEDRVAYLTLFPIGPVQRGNLFVYWDPHDPRLGALREMPEETLRTMFPGLAGVAAPFCVASAVKVRPVDLTESVDAVRPGIVLVGDAFATSCPAAGTGLNKVLTDVDRLCRHHIPRWLATPGMSERKIASYYADPVKRECDAASLAKAFRLRSLSTDPGFRWSAERLGRSMAQTGRGIVHEAGARLSALLLLPIGL